MARPRTAQQSAAAPLLMLLCTRLRRITARFAALEAGAAPPKPRRPVDPAKIRSREPRPGPRLPRGAAWLMRLLPGTAACFGSQLNTLLAEPEMVALLQAEPRAAALLRPLCRMLAIPVIPAPRPKVAVPAAAAAPAAASGEPATPAPPDPAIPPGEGVSRSWRTVDLPGLIFKPA